MKKEKIVNYYSGNTNIDPDKNEGYWKSLLIINDGLSNIILEINNMRMIIKSKEKLDECFKKFNNFILTTNNSNYRMWLRE